MGDNIHFVNYNNVRDFMETKVSDINRDTWQEYLKQHQQQNDYDFLNWYGSKSIEEVIKICREGWVAGLEIYRNIKDSIPEIEISGYFHKQYKRKKKYSDSGDEVDIDRYIHNEFESMFIDQQRYVAEKHGKIITIYSSFAFNSHRSSRESLWMGMTTCVLTDILESAGYRVEIIGFCALNNLFNESPSPYKAQLNINIKNPEHPLDLVNVLMVSAYPGFFRYFGLKTICSLPYRIQKFFGYAVQTPYVKPQETFLISEIWNSQEAYRKTVFILNEIKNRELNNLIL